MSDSDEAVAHFARDTATGRLSFQGCVTGETGNACTPIPSATPAANDSGMEYPTVARVSRALRRRGKGTVKLKAVAGDLLGNDSKERGRVKLKRRAR